MRTRILFSLALVAGLGLPRLAKAQQDTTHKPVTPATVAHNTDEEAERVAKRTGKTVKKGANDTGKQAKRTAKSIKKIYSRKARNEGKGKDTTSKPE